MYSVYAILPDSSTMVLYDDRLMGDEYRLLDPTLTLRVNSAGSFTCTIPMTNVGYSAIKRISSNLVITRDNVRIWEGRVIGETSDFWNNRRIVCEGVLSYLNDSVQYQYYEQGPDVKEFLEKVIKSHNASCAHQFYVRTVTVSDPGPYASLWYHEYESSMQCIQKHLLDAFGGYIRAVYLEEGLAVSDSSGSPILDSGGAAVTDGKSVWAIDYLSEPDTISPQVIRFGMNLLDLRYEWDSSAFCTALLPLGKGEKDSSWGPLTEYVTVRTVSDPNVKGRFVLSEAINEYGRIEKVVEWPDVTDEKALLDLAKRYLADSQFDSMVITVSAVDMSLLSDSVAPFSLLDKVRCISEPHGMDKYFVVTEIEIPLDRPENAKYTLETSGKFSPSTAISSILAKK